MLGNGRTVRLFGTIARRGEGTPREARLTLTVVTVAALRRLLAGAPVSVDAKLTITGDGVHALHGSAVIARRPSRLAVELAGAGLRLHVVSLDAPRSLGAALSLEGVLEEREPLRASRVLLRFDAARELVPRACVARR